MRPKKLTRPKSRFRRGAATVEFAVIAPIFVIILLGMVQASRLFNLQTQVVAAAREGARMASMDRTGMLQAGQTTNQKITQDIRNFLTANGLPGAAAAVNIVDAVDHRTPFNLDDPANDLQLFEVRVELDSQVGSLVGNAWDSRNLAGTVVFRNARTALVQ